MNIAIAILNWNGLELLKTFLPSVVAHSDEANIYIIDNQSTDNSCAFVKQHFPDIQIIRNDGNFGYSGGYNRGLQDLKEDIFILLNNDVEVTEGWLQPIHDMFVSEEKVAVVQPKIADYKNKSYFEYAGAAGGFIDKFGYPFCKGRIFDVLEEDLGQYDMNSPIFWASGACLAIRRDVFYKAGKLDEHYFAHQEEIDLCWRVQNLGYTIMYAFESKVYHKGGSTLSAYNPQKTFLNFRNSLFNLIKNAKFPLVLFLVLIRLVLDGLAGFKFLFSGKFKHVWAILRAHLSFYTNFFLILKLRPKEIRAKKYSKITSIVFSYFVLQKKKFSDLQ